MHVFAAPAIKNPRFSCFLPSLGSRRLRASVAGVLCAIGAALAGPGVAAATSHSSASDGTGLISVTSQACAPGWAAPRSGLSDFTVHDATQATPYRVEIVGASSSEIYGELAMVAPGTVASFEALLPPGRYAFYCLSSSGPSRRSVVGVVSGPPVSGAHPYLPLSVKALEVATSSYHRALAAWVSKLVANTSSLCAAVAAGRTSSARQLWLSAQLDFDRMGGAPSLFGTLAGQIDGSPLGLQGGAASPYFLGLRRLEYGLWGQQSRAQLMAVCAQLLPAVRQLAAEFPRLVFPPDVLAQAAISQLEQVYELGLTGQLDEGSHTDLASAWAQVLAAGTAISAISSSGASASDKVTLDAAGHAHGSLAATLAHFRSSSGRWVALSSLAQSQREALDSQFGDVLDALALVPALVDGQAPPGGSHTAPSAITTTTGGTTATPARAVAGTGLAQ
jgi:iron uptake system EfeUOB component EfeO/EfeM